MIPKTRSRFARITVSIRLGKDGKIKEWRGSNTNNEQTSGSIRLFLAIFYYICAVKEYATLQVASPRLRFIIIDTAKAGAINLRHFP